MFSVVEMAQMYNSFAGRGVFCLLDESASMRLADLYQEGHRFSVAVIIKAFTQVRDDPRHLSAIQTVPVEVILSGRERSFTALCSLQGNRFAVSMFSETSPIG
jgi:hypothetical protein